MNAYRVVTGTPARRRKPLFSELDLHPGLSQLGAQPPVLRRLLCTDLGVHGLRVVLSPFLDPAPHRLRHQAVGPRHLGYCPVLLHDLKDDLLLELTTESLCRHNQIIPHLSKQYSFHHCPRNTRHLSLLSSDGGVWGVILVVVPGWRVRGVRGDGAAWQRGR